MDDRLNETWQETEVDVQLQERFLSLMESCGIYLPPQLKIGAIFLRNNIDLLEG